MAPGAQVSGAVMAAPQPNGFGTAAAGGGSTKSSAVAALAAAAQQIADPRIEAQLAQLSRILSASTAVVPVAHAEQPQPTQPEQQSLAMQEVLLRHHMQKAATSGMEQWQPSQLARPMSGNAAVPVPLSRQAEPMVQPPVQAPAARPAQRAAPRPERRLSRVRCLHRIEGTSAHHVGCLVDA
jgi:hypothetical protein